MSSGIRQSFSLSLGDGLAWQVDRAFSLGVKRLRREVFQWCVDFVTCFSAIRLLLGIGQAVADAITEKIAAGDANAWQTPVDAHATVISILTLPVPGGSATSTVLSDVDGDGWLETHTWNPQQFHLSLDTGGDGNVQALRDLVTLVGGPNSLTWLDTNGDHKLDATDPAFAAIRLWLDANGDAQQQTGEAVSLMEAGISAIDFTTAPPALIDTQGNRLELSESRITRTGALLTVVAMGWAVPRLPCPRMRPVKSVSKWVRGVVPRRRLEALSDMPTLQRTRIS